MAANKAYKGRGPTSIRICEGQMLTLLMQCLDDLLEVERITRKKSTSYDKIVQRKTLIKSMVRKKWLSNAK